MSLNTGRMEYNDGAISLMLIPQFRRRQIMLRQPRYSMDEHVRRGEEIYEQFVRSQVENGNRGKIVAIDIESGQYEVAESVLAASRQLLARLPDAQIWCVRIGHRAVHRIGLHVIVGEI